MKGSFLFGVRALQKGCAKGEVVPGPSLGHQRQLFLARHAIFIVAMGVIRKSKRWKTVENHLSIELCPVTQFYKNTSVYIFLFESG